MRKNSFYSTYAQFKEYHRVSISRRNLREFERNVWRPLAAKKEHRFLELGCGLGHILVCLHAKGVQNFLGIDADENIAAYLPAEIKTNFIAGDVRRIFGVKKKIAPFDRVVMLDTLEHLSTEEGFGLLQELQRNTSANAKILIRVPNASSPWGLQNQYGDLTHVTAYTPDSLRQIAIAANWRVISVFPHREGSGFKLFTESLFHGLIAALISRPPEIWTANFYGVLEKKAATADFPG